VFSGIRKKGNRRFGRVIRQNDPHEFLMWLSEQFEFIFDDQLMDFDQILTCPQCKRQDIMQIKKEVFISIPVFTKLTDSMDYFWEETDIERNACRFCAFSGRHHMRHVLSKEPKMLCLQLKRWQGDESEKDETGIEIPMNLQIGARTYTLHAIIEHHGKTTDTGHYTAYVQYDTFVCTDDLLVSQKEPELAHNKRAYLLMYNAPSSDSTP
jgi:ubiquitin C-terminal hydrolase